MRDKQRQLVRETVCEQNAKITNRYTDKRVSSFQE